MELERRLPFVRALAEMIAELGLAHLREEAFRHRPASRTSQAQQ
jgi:hypothetical protein